MQCYICRNNLSNIKFSKKENELCNLILSIEDQILMHNIFKPYLIKVLRIFLTENVLYV